uniref:Uncharacterized protein n=2 Tax=Meloidogyne TaxID=189290 RepID=A0A6V7UGK7_MELEN|nr:unnamed protein product [Meloidogyne enterolobii]
MSLIFPTFLLFLFSLITFTLADSALKNRCYSCASENMKEDFISRDRGPPGRVKEPKLYDSMCDLDSWLIRDKSSVDCNGPCFKWQQILNNSGVLSYSTIRDCYERLFDQANNRPTPSSSIPNYTTQCKHSIRELNCLDKTSVEEHTCFCSGDFCNFAKREEFKNSVVIYFAIMFILKIIFIN